MAKLTSSYLSAMRARMNAATPGPWRVNGGTAIVMDNDGDLKLADCRNPKLDDLWDSKELANATFIASARSDMSLLLDEVEQLRTLVATLEVMAPHRQSSKLSAHFDCPGCDICLGEE